MKIAKILTANDVGATGSGQEGITIPKRRNLLSFFPRLNPRVKNPRVEVKMIDKFDNSWFFGFVYYNNKFFEGTRNEYRLSKTIHYIRSCNLNEGDSIIFFNDEKKRRIISNSKEEDKSYMLSDNVIKLSGDWYEYKISNG